MNMFNTDAWPHKADSQRMQRSVSMGLTRPRGWSNLMPTRQFRLALIVLRGMKVVVLKKLKKGKLVGLQDVRNEVMPNVMW